MAKKRKLKKGIKRNFIFFILLIILSVVGNKLYKDYKYKQTYEYKLLEINYTLDDTKVLLKHLDNKEIEEILNKDYINNLTLFITQDYFMYKNLDRYLTYYEKNAEKKIEKIISLVNVNRDRDFYEEPNKTPIALGELMIVNKYFYLEKDYIPEDIVETSGSYSYENNSINENVYIAFQELANVAKEAGYTILINSSYRDYNSQEEVWSSRKSLYGTRKADEYAARAGYSEHQTGYAIDVADFYDVNDKFGDTESFLWMKENCYNYGFILRYPEDKEDITGYNYEPWHYRYVGKEVANIIKQKGITFDEYYAYYLEDVKL